MVDADMKALDQQARGSGNGFDWVAKQSRQREQVLGVVPGVYPYERRPPGGPYTHFINDERIVTDTFKPINLGVLPNLVCMADRVLP
jgi:hypothetical protein